MATSNIAFHGRLSQLDDDQSSLDSAGHGADDQTSSSEGEDDDSTALERHSAEDGADDQMDETTSEQDGHVFLRRSKQTRNAGYDYASERQTSHSEAKQFYQRHQQERNNADGLGRSPLLHARTMPPNLDSMPANLGRADTIKAHKRQPTGPTGAVGQQADAHATEAQRKGQSSKRASKDDSEHSVQGHEFSPPMTIVESPDGEAIHSGLMPPPEELGSESEISSELVAIFGNVQKVLDIRHKYIGRSLQGPMDNPKDDPEWQIYPPHPEPVWDDSGDKPSFSNPNTASNSAILDRDSRTKKSPRKPGRDIGEDFDLKDLLPLPEESEMTFRLDTRGVFQVYRNSKAEKAEAPIGCVPDIREFYMDLDEVLEASSDGPSKSLAYRRLQYLEGKFNLYTLLNGYQEIADSKKVPHRDFYNVRKVDTHVHHSACMNQKHLLRFIKSKMRKCPDEVVLFRDGKYLTLQEVFDSINLTAYDLSIDTLDMHAHTDSFHRFDKFNLKYNPVGESRLRTIFLKTDNLIKGRYLADITKEVISDLESSKYQMVEWRISIYGKSLDEWDNLAAWIVDNKLFSPNVRWLIQVPRLYDVYKASKIMDNFEQVIVNLFQPLFEVTKDPNSHPKLHVMLQRVVGFDCVDDESKSERRLYRKFPLPSSWNTKQNPPYSYWIYFLYANMTSLNMWRKQRGFNTFLLRPHCGEAGDLDHLAVATLCCHSINHGLLLRKMPLLQYVFYLDQIGMAMSPLSNNALFLNYERNPFHSYFKRGLNVSLSSDDPLQFAFTKEPLIEEYSVAAQIYKLTGVDMCELSKHSVEQSGFEHSIKQRWLGANYQLPGVAGNDVAKVNVPDIREQYRHDTWLGEMSLLAKYTRGRKASSTASDSVQTASGKTTMPVSPQLTKGSSSSAINATPDNQQQPPLTLPPHTLPNPSSPTFLTQAARKYPNISPVDLQTMVSGSSTIGDQSSNPPSPLQKRLSRSETMPASGIGQHDEPRMFPGVVNRRRKGSVRENPSSDATG